MQIFTYPSFFRFLYRFGNIPISLILLLYLVPSVVYSDKNLLYLIPVVVILYLIYYINRKYLTLYKIIPYKITADEEKLACSDFIFSGKEVNIYYKDIVKLTGGIFDGRHYGLMLVYDGRNKVHIGFHHKIKNAKELETIILKRVNQPVYDEVRQRIDLKIRKIS